MPDSFHEALATILGFSVRRETSTRQFLCGVRLVGAPRHGAIRCCWRSEAVPQQGQAQGQASAEAGDACLDSLGTGTLYSIMVFIFVVLLFYTLLYQLLILSYCYIIISNYSIMINTIRPH